MSTESPFRRTETRADGQYDASGRWPGTVQTTSRPGGAGMTLAQQVIDGVTHGQTPRMVARNLGQPLELVELIIEQARAQGKISTYDLTSCNSATGEGCNPDAESLVCASCPILPRAIRKQQSIFGRLKKRL